MTKPGFAQHDAGVLQNDKISPGAKRKFIQDVKNELIMGTANAPKPALPCGPSFPPVPFADQLMLEDETKFPEFHKNVFGLYEQIARALDVQGQFMFAPVVVDPLALAVKLQLKPPKLSFPRDFGIYGVGLPLLAIKLGFDIPIELGAKLPGLLMPAIPKLNLPIPPNIDPLKFPDLLKFSFPFDKFPNLLASLAVQMPTLFLKLLAFDLKPFCEAVLKSQLFGPIQSDSVVQVVAAKVLARKTAECTTIAVVASTVGSASTGVVGGLGRHFGYEPPPGPEGSDDDIRSRIVQAARRADGFSWSQDKLALKTARGNHSEAKLDYTCFLLPEEVGNGSSREIQNAFNKAQSYSSCGLFVRGCYLRGGAGDSFFTGRYREGSAISGLLDVARKQGALINFSRNNIPAMKQGDSVLVQRPGVSGSEHVLMLTDDYSGGEGNECSGIEGGRPDEANEGRPTSIENARYRFFTSGGKVRASKNETTFEVLKIIDGERICAS